MQASDDGVWSWNPERVQPGEVVLTPSYRFAELNTIIEPEGTRVFADCIDGALLCKHGELGTSVATWNHLEQVARREGRPPPPRPSLCDCTSTTGLNKKRSSRPPPEASRLPASLFDHLCAMGTARILIAGREARQLPFTSGEQAAFLTSEGRIICRHGRLRSSLVRMRQRGRTRCTCAPKGFPKRRSTVSVGAEGEAGLGRACGGMGGRDVV